MNRESSAKEKTCFLPFTVIIPEHQLKGSDVQEQWRAVTANCNTADNPVIPKEVICKGHTPDISHLNFIKLSSNKLEKTVILKGKTKVLTTFRRIRDDVSKR